MTSTRLIETGAAIQLPGESTKARRRVECGDLGLTLAGNRSGGSSDAGADVENAGAGRDRSQVDERKGRRATQAVELIETGEIVGINRVSRTPRAAQGIENNPVEVLGARRVIGLCLGVAHWSHP